MNDYISRKDVLNLVRIGYLVSNSNSRKIVDHINAIPTADVVSREVVNQIKWERDTAIQQLEELGYGFGESQEDESDVVEVVRCKDCKHWDTTWESDWTKSYHYCPFIDGTSTGDWYCADAERREDERSD